MKATNDVQSKSQNLIKESLTKLNRKQFKIFYAIIVHCRAHDKYFISTQNLLNLWCELNLLCAEFDESFPTPYDDHLLIKSFCSAHPYYFIDILPLELIVDLFTEYLDLHLETLLKLIQFIDKKDYKIICRYIIDEFNINDHTPDELICDLENHIKQHS